MELLILFAIIFAIQLYNKRDTVSGVVPIFSAPLLGGSVFSTAQQQDKPYLIHFWAEWCPVCRLEEDNINSISEDHTVITVAMQSGTAQEIKRYMSEKGLHFPVIVDEQGQLAQLFGVKGVPASFIINRDNSIEFVEVGYTTELGLRARLWLANRDRS